MIKFESFGIKEDTNVKVTFKNEPQVTAFRNETQIQKYISDGRLSEKHVEFVREYISLLRKYGVMETLAGHLENDYIKPVGDDGVICFAIPDGDNYEDILVSDVCNGHVILYPSEYSPEGKEIWF